MEKMEAKDLVIKAGHELVAEGLIARTWGNISCRISDEEFVITPSGRSYEDLVRSEIVPVRIDDCSWSGTVKPSSEKAVHAALYRLHPEANFIIHTHQNYATAIGATGRTLRGFDREYMDVLGRVVPCAEYGISTTKPLAENVEAAAALYPEAKAILMRNHGAVCIGSDYDDAFEVARTLEKLCKARFEDLTVYYNLPEAFIPGTDSARHMINYRTGGGRTFAFLKSTFVRKMADLGKPVPAYIDDCAQMSGGSIRCLPATATKTDILRALVHYPMVFVKTKGAVCVGSDKEEADAVCMVLEKNCLAAWACEKTGEGRPVSPLAARLEHLIYVMKYSKLKNA